MKTTSSTFEKVLNELQEQLHDELVLNTGLGEVKVGNYYFWIESYKESSNTVKVCVHNANNEYGREYPNIEAYLSKALSERVDFRAIDMEAEELRMEEEDWEDTKCYLNETYR